MEFLQVLVPGYHGIECDVLINREKNGKVGEILMLSPGFLWVSVEHPSAEETLLELRDTTPQHPRIVEIHIEPVQEEDLFQGNEGTRAAPRNKEVPIWKQPDASEETHQS